MNTASLKEIKKELEITPPDKLLEICLQLTKFKKENKELLSYLLFDEGNEPRYIENVKEILDTQHQSIHKSNWYFAKKGIRKMVSLANKHIKYSKIKTTEIDLLIYVCEKINALNINKRNYPVLNNIYEAQLKKIHKIIDTLHEDEQYDYLKLVEELVE